MKRFKRGLLLVTVGILAGVPSLFWGNWGRMQNVYGALLITLGFVQLRFTGRCFRLGLYLSMCTLAVLLVSFDTFLHGVFGLWVVGTLVTTVYALLLEGINGLLVAAGAGTARRDLRTGLIALLVANMVYICLHSWQTTTLLGILPLLAQLYTLALLWGFGRKVPEDLLQ